MRDAPEVVPLDGDDCAELVAIGAHGFAHPAQVAQPLLAHVRDEEHIAGGRDLLRLHQARGAQDRRDAEAVVSDAGTGDAIRIAAHGYICFGGEDRVGMGGEHHRRAIARARPPPDDIADRVGMHIGEADGGHFLRDKRGALALRARRRRDLRNAHGEGNGLLLAVLDPTEETVHARLGE